MHTITENPSRKAVSDMNDFADESIHPDLQQNIRRLREISDNGSDLMINEFLLSGVPAALVTC